MEQVRKERIGEIEACGNKKKPYSKPTLTIHGDVDEITEVLRLAGAKGQVLSEPASDRNAKENFAPVDGRDILARLVTIPIETWNYKAEDPTVRHIGPMAQDFAEAFGVGEDDKRIHMIDASGVALASIQALHKVVLERDGHIKVLQEQVRELQAELAELKTELIPLGG
jgi:hypothetical protein